MNYASVFNEPCFWILLGLVLIFFAFCYALLLFQQIRDLQIEILENIFLERL